MIKVPVTVITGFLGSGKSTLLRNLLNNKDNVRIAIIENEFANETGIEKAIIENGHQSASSLLESSSSSSNVFKKSELFIELSNGCVCCTVKDSLVATLELLLQKKQKFDHIIIETSGLADPGPLASVFWVDDELDSEIELNGVITLVDCVNYAQYEGLYEFNRQVLYADRVILNKASSVSSHVLGKVEEKIKGMNPLCEIVTADYGVVAMGFVLNVKSLENSRVLSLFNVLNDYNSEAMPKKINNQQHLQDFSSIVLKTNSKLDLEKFRLFIANLLWGEEKQKATLEIYRIKGVINGNHIIQSVFQTFDLYPIPSPPTTTTTTTSDPGAPPTAVTTRVVMIGKGLKEAKNDIQIKFNDCTT